MRENRPRATFVVLAPALVVAMVAPASGVARAQAKQSPSPSASSAGGSYTSATACASCHRLIHTYWAESAHAQSATKPSYLEGLDAAVAAAPPSRTSTWPGRAISST